MSQERAANLAIEKDPTPQRRHVSERPRRGAQIAGSQLLARLTYQHRAESFVKRALIFKSKPVSARPGHVAQMLLDGVAARPQQTPGLFRRVAGMQAVVQRESIEHDDLGRLGNSKPQVPVVGSPYRHAHAPKAFEQVGTNERLPRRKERVGGEQCFELNGGCKGSLSATHSVLVDGLQRSADHTDVGMLVEKLDLPF